jgi:hypothetical protein
VSAGSTRYCPCRHKNAPLALRAPFSLVTTPTPFSSHGLALGPRWSAPYKPGVARGCRVDDMAVRGMYRFGQSSAAPKTMALRDEPRTLGPRRNTARRG